MRNSDSYIEQAFNAVCKDAKQAVGAYVCLMEMVPYYGGPEEGGWWGEDHEIVAYQYYPTLEQAKAAEESVLRLAGELNEESRREYGEHCQKSVEWLDERGLDSSFLPEPDGNREYYVLMCDTLPEPRKGCRHYE